MLCACLAAAFVFLVIYLLWPVLVYFVFRIFLCKRGDLKKAGEWAIVTGATDGIGKAFAELLAKEGLNIFLISRTEAKLLAVAAELEKKYNVKTRIFVADFAKENFSYDQLQSEIEGLSSISCLFNNVGISYVYPDALHSSPFLTPSFCQDIVTINVTTLTKLTRLILPKMISDPLPVHGVRRYVINMGSLSGLLTTPYLTVYGATKAYICSFTKALAVELRDTRVRVQMFAPSFVSTKMSGIKRTSIWVPSAETYANSALSMIGVETIGCGYFIHALIWQFLCLVPSCQLSSYMAKRMLSARERHLRKQKTN
ncbi:Very-long-chain 3-oxoacyl-CoA reductase [Echinococcus granulosus]|nr:Very-long-chain 3-oxoacyl-CoA reductase [Echinococcus granulosus]